jgi:hypothetical protein
MLDFEKIIEAMAEASYKILPFDDYVQWGDIGKIYKQHFRIRAKAALKALATELPGINEILEYYQEEAIDVLIQLKEFGNENN